MPTFLSPERLLLLLLPLLVAAAYLVAQRRRPAAVARFTSVDLLASVAPRRPGWQRHLAPAGAVLALAAMVVGFAQPARTVRTPKETATLMLAIDVSGSMVAEDVAPSRLEASKAAASTFVDALPRGIRLGLVTFASNARVVVPPTGDRASVKAALAAVNAGGGTATGDAIDLALEAITGQPKTAEGKTPPAAIVLMSDGTPTVGNDDEAPAVTLAAAATAAKEAGVPVNTISFGTASGTAFVQGQTVKVPSDPEAMARVAETSGGRTFTAQSADQLKTVYSDIGKVVGFDVHRVDVGPWFLAAGFGLAMLSSLAGVRYAQKVF